MGEKIFKNTQLPPLLLGANVQVENEQEMLNVNIGKQETLEIR